MNIWKILTLFLIFVPDCIQIFLYKIFYLLFAKRKFKNKINIHFKKSTNSKNNLVIVNNMRALGDLFVSLNIIKKINEQKSDYKYVFVINEIYKELILKENFKNVDFIFLKHDFGPHYDREKIDKKDICNISNNISDQIKDYSKDWNNVFICSCWLDSTHYSILSKINYNSAYNLKNFITKSKPRIIFQNNTFIPSTSLWLYFFHFYKRFNVKIWNLKSKDIYYFGKMSYDMIKDKDNSLSPYSVDNIKKNVQIKDLTNISVMLKTSSKTKDIDVNKFVKFLKELDLNKNTNINFLNKHYYDIPSIKDLNVINLTGKTQNLLDLVKCVKKSKLVITADTSLYHISSYFNIPTIVFIRPKMLTNRIQKYWLENYKNNLIIVNKYFFKKKLFNQKKEFNKIKNEVKSFLKDD